MSKPDKIKIGLLGLGTVGSGVYKLIEKQKEEFCKKAGADVEIVKILVHNMEKSVKVWIHLFLPITGEILLIMMRSDS